MRRAIKKLLPAVFEASGWNARELGSLFSAGGRVLILLYHRVRRPEDIYEAAVSPENFELQMKYLAGNFEVLSLADSMRLMEREETPGKPPAVITFDDGYRDNWQTACPILKKYGLPATFFIATGSMGNREPMWTSRVEFLFAKAPVRTLVLETLPSRESLDLREPGRRQYVCHWVKNEMKKVPEERRRLILEELEQKSGVRPPENFTGPEMLDWDEVRLMAHDPLFEIGSHTVSHRMLAHLSTEEVRHELEASKKAIEAETGRTARFLSFPGNSHDGRTRRLAREAGYEAACAVGQALCSYDADPFELKRVHIEDGGLGHFRAQISLLMERARGWARRLGVTG
ncbi:MAG: polysaccharide deacetylase family protein [Candidatus Omnitrophica bacterium]|nr:polysaccharide deacetylase family protein [Candidatus Omnitrophota bacterium]